MLVPCAHLASMTMWPQQRLATAQAAGTLSNSALRNLDGMNQVPIAPVTMKGCSVITHHTWITHPQPELGYHTGLSWLSHLELG